MSPTQITRWTRCVRICGRSCRPAALLLVAAEAACCSSRPPIPETLTVSDDLRSCGHPAAAPKPLPKVVSVPGLRAGYDAEHAARVGDQAAAIECGRKLVLVMEAVDAFNLTHKPH